MVSSVQEGQAAGAACPRFDLDLDLDALALEPLEHPLILLRGREPGPDRLPGPPSPDAPVLRLLDADQRRLRRRIDGVVVHLEPELDREHMLFLRRDRI